MDNPVAKYIRDERRRRLLSVRRLARLAGISAAYLSQIENGNRPLTATATGRIADGLGMPPYQLLTLAGFIPTEHTEKAEAMADRALKEAPEIVAVAKHPNEDARTYLTIDYLYLLGDDPYGTGWDGSPGHAAPWHILDPSAPPPMMERLKPEIDAWKAEMEKVAKKPLDGWDLLTLREKELIQHLVDKFIADRTAGK